MDTQSAAVDIVRPGLLYLPCNGGAEFAGPENGGPKKTLKSND